VDTDTQTSPTITIAVIGEDQHDGFTSIFPSSPSETGNSNLYFHRQP
jgi:hypothetical protein